MNYRRFATLKIAAHVAAGEGGLAAVWRAKRAERPWTPFPADLPADPLTCAGYLAIEDAQGASIEELLSAGLTFDDASAVLVFLATLPSP